MYGRALIGAMRLGKDTVFAQTDGGLQIVIPRKGDDGIELDDEIVYERAYYELALGTVAGQRNGRTNGTTPYKLYIKPKKATQFFNINWQQEGNQKG